MRLTETVIEGTLKPDGTLELDQKPNLSPGRVTVVLRQEAVVELPKDDPFWLRMQAMWDIPDLPGANTGGAEDSVADLQRMREEWEEHQLAIERLQDKSPATRHGQEESKP
jgi:hypothetical protein